MIIERIRGNIADLSAVELAARHLERVRLPLSDLTRRILRVTGDHGTEVGIRLPAGTRLADGDILHDDGHNLIVITVDAADVLVIAPQSIREMGIVAHGLGNRHLPAQFFGEGSEFGIAHHGVMVIQYDHTAEHFLEQHGVPFVRQSRTLDVPFRHTEHTH